MKRFTSFIFFAVAIMGLSIVSVSAQTSDAEIGKQVSKEIRKYTNYGVFDYITYEVNGGNVTLKGKVVTLGTKSAAENLAKKVKGVSEVTNNIEELPLSSMDNDIRWSLIRTFSAKGLYRYVTMPNPEVHIIVENGRVTLEGNVSNQGDADRLKLFANSVTGTFQVTSNVVVGKVSA